MDTKTPPYSAVIHHNGKRELTEARCPPIKGPSNAAVWSQASPREKNLPEEHMGVHVVTDEEDIITCKPCVLNMVCITPAIESSHNNDNVSTHKLDQCKLKQYRHTIHTCTCTCIHAYIHTIHTHNDCSPMKRRTEQARK
jgi:hypothetical protein